MFVEPRRAVSVDELLHGVVVQSQRRVDRDRRGRRCSESAFVALMNAEAERMGLAGTHFTNATGLPRADHYSTARDLAVLAAAIIRDYPDHYSLYSLKEYRYNNITQPNRNRLLWVDPYVDGMKTGHTDTAGWCLIASAKRGERRLLSVVLGAASDAARTTESERLLNYGFQAFDTVQLYQSGKAVNAACGRARHECRRGFFADRFSGCRKAGGGARAHDDCDGAAGRAGGAWPTRRHGQGRPRGADSPSCRWWRSRTPEASLRAGVGHDAALVQMTHCATHEPVIVYLNGAFLPLEEARIPVSTAVSSMVTASTS
jgi:hypothetical protein